MHVHLQIPMALETLPRCEYRRVRGTPATRTSKKSQGHRKCGTIARLQRVSQWERRDSKVEWAECSVVIVNIAQVIVSRITNCDLSAGQALKKLNVGG
jgi:hypothetical protein